MSWNKRIPCWSELLKLNWLSSIRNLSLKMSCIILPTSGSESDELDPELELEVGDFKNIEGILDSKIPKPWIDCWTDPPSLSWYSDDAAAWLRSTVPEEISADVWSKMSLNSDEWTIFNFSSKFESSRIIADFDECSLACSLDVMPKNFFSLKELMPLLLPIIFDSVMETLVQAWMPVQEFLHPSNGLLRPLSTWLSAHKFSILRDRREVGKDDADDDVS